MPRLRANIEHIDHGFMGQCPRLHRDFYPPRPALSPLFSHPYPILLPSIPFFPTRDMTDQPGSARFQAFLERALQAYEKKAGVTLADSDDSLVIGLQCCYSIDDIATLLQDKTQTFNDVRQCDRIFKSIRATVTILTPTSPVASDDAGLVRPKVLKACLSFLTIVTEVTPTYHGDTFYSRHPTGRMCHY